MRKYRGFTLIELLIVVAIIAILAAIAVPNFLEAQVRAKVSRVRADMRSIATAIEAYSVDTNMYPASTQDEFSVNSQFPTSGDTEYDLSGQRSTFAALGLSLDAEPEHHFMILTTPVGYITALPSDPFADKKGVAFGYANGVDVGWIMWSYGPDTDEQFGSQLDAEFYDSEEWKVDDWAKQTVYNPFRSNPMPALLYWVSERNTDNETAFTYDTTNGSVSDGDVWRFASQ